MRRRDYLAACASVSTLVGCIGDDGLGAVEDVGELTEADTAGGVLHHWPLHDRQDDVVEDVVGEAHGEASETLVNVAGNWYESHAEEARLGSRGYIDLGYLDSINGAVNAREVSLLATIWPMEISPDWPNTILGAGGGGSDWFEFRLTEAATDGTGRLELRVIDRRANGIAAVADRPIEVGELTRVGTSLGGTTAEDIAFWIDGTPVDATAVMTDGLYYATEPDQSYGIFASNPSSGDTNIGTRNWFTGTIDNVVVARFVLDDEGAESDYREQPWI